jgi:TonB-dependent SusC/RagA subfamily outer membrane receptor
MTEIADTRPVTSLSASLHGLAAGLSVNQGNARPGGDGATLRIRGQGTLNNSNPLVIIDGVEGDMNALNAQDVENISVLKDAASAAIYGSRAANGVILITTKSGKAGVLRLNYNGHVSTQAPTNLITPVSNYADYMELYNEASRNADPNAQLQFSQASIDLWRANEGGDQLMYPNTDWTEEVFSSNISQNQNLSFSGGTDKLSLFGSFGYLDNPGIIENAGFERYSARINADAQVKDWLKVGINASGYVSSAEIGTNLLDGSVFAFAAASTPGMVIRSPD